MSPYRHYVLCRIRDEAWQASLEAEAREDRTAFLYHRQAWAKACEELAAHAFRTMPVDNRTPIR